jgi:O-phospho-L-seryl-tRNASec:L-selenocysteinyl-tRNA synthase
MIKDRKIKFVRLKEIMQSIASKYNERILDIPNNKISLSMTLSSICKDLNDKKDVTYLGSLFYSRQISGIRIIASGGTTKLHDKTFSNYGSNCEKYPFLPYATFAAAIGITDTEVSIK